MLGAMYRSVWGRALHSRLPQAFDLFFNGNADLRPWWIRPADVGLSTQLPEGMLLRSRITLQESAWPYLNAALDSLSDFRVYGLGRERAPALLTDVRGMTPSGAQPLGSAMPHFWDAASVWQVAQQETISLAPLQLHTHTPLRLKEGGNLLRHFPDMDTLVQRCMGRAQMLLPDGSGALLARDEKHAWLSSCKDLPAENVDLSHFMVERYSARQGQSMPIEGVAGSWSYCAQSRHALPWLRLAEHLQLGGKTTIGFGAFSVDAVPHAVRA